jgi:microcystin-dependent protein
MSNPFVAEIRIVGFNFAPTGWATCDGQLLPISQNTALFSLLGTTYGGDGKSTFQLPNLQDSSPMQQGAGLGLSSRYLGEEGGEPSVTLISSEMPLHPHQVSGWQQAANLFVPGGAIWAESTSGTQYQSAATAGAFMAGDAFPPAGGSQPHNNMPPFLTLLFVIALQGVYPARP